MSKLAAILLSVVPFLAMAQAGPIGNKAYRENIKTILLYKAGFEMSAPVMNLTGGAGQLILSFDDLDADLKHFRFTIIHCDAGWIPSVDITSIDYISGFRDEEITDYGYSYNTIQHYTHYSLQFPSANLRPAISGNYILKVFLDDPEDVILTRRFMVLENTPMGITGEAGQASSVTGRFTDQEVDFVIHPNGMRVQNPERELRVMVTQNEREDNEMRDLKPRFARGDELDYNYNGEKVFGGANEFRDFDIKSLIYQTERVAGISYDSGRNQVFLLQDSPRTFKNYATEKDINGRKLIKNEENAKNSDIEADYAWVYFFLRYPVFLSNGGIYITGAITDWQLDETSRMVYDFERKGYEKRLYLKQGYYNYLYLFRDNKSGLTDAGLIEGNHWETENQYTVWVYFRETGGLYDRLICVQDFNTIH